MADEQQFCDKIFGAMADDLWIKRRLELSPIEDKLQAMLDEPQIGLATKEMALDWLKFVQFLRVECSGLYFSDDKQWSELMNSMEISKKFNHRSVKLKELIKNKRLIETNSGRIKRLNESAKLVSSISQSLSELESLVQSCRLDLPTSFSSFLEYALQSYICDRIADSQRHIRNYCKPLLSNLALELDNQLVAKHSHLDEWCKSLTSHGNSIKLIADFLQNFRRLQENLSHLGPLLCGTTSEQDDDETVAARSERHQPLQVSLRLIMLKFKKVVKFNDIELMNALHKVSGRSAGDNKVPSGRLGSTKDGNSRKKQQVVCVVPLLKLVDTKTGDYSSDLFGCKLNSALEQLQECDSALEGIMINLRLEFGRFYFINNLELLTIISLDSRLVESADNERLVRKLFNNSISRFLLNAEQTSIVGVLSPIGEQIKFSGVEPVPLKKRVNIYSLEIVRILNEALRKLRRTLRKLSADELAKSPGKTPSSDLSWSLPVQLMTLVDQLRFTRRAELALEQSVATSGQSLVDLLAQYELRFKQLMTKTEIQADTAQKSLRQVKRSAALSMSVHFISTLQQLREQRAGSARDWNWLKLVRYYMVGNLTTTNSEADESWQLEVRLAGAKFDYKFHYLPVELTDQSYQWATLEQVARPTNRYKRLISTRTSEKCFLIAAQAVAKLRLGASPYGPAGSGKTETIKALGQLIGSQVIVHNCDESNDANSLERLIWGLAHTGLWGCFDEFNRLDAGTLSSVSATLELVQASLRQGKQTLELEQGQIKTIDESSAFFITLNPVDASKYRGRRRLPANLRSLFLPISMVCVQVDAIVSEILLVDCDAYQLNADKARQLGLKLAQWLDWMRNEWQQAFVASRNCEWDLRLVMVILKRIKALSCADNNEAGKKKIELLLVKSIRFELMPRLSSGEQVAKLESSLALAFPEAVHEYDSQVKFDDKLDQIIEQLRTRPGVILMGPSRAGKTRTWQAACERFNSIAKLDWFVLNPKSCYKGDLFGRFESAVGDGKMRKWCDGIFTKLVRKAQSMLAQSDSNSLHQVWIVLDGLIDPDWIECLNSVLDDNQVLTLSSGERLNFVYSPLKCIKLLFETLDLQHASSATISRLGLVSFPVGVKHQAQEIDLSAFLERKCNQQLLLVAGSSSHLAQCDFVRCTLDKQRYVEYDCFEGCTSEHLLDVLNNFMTGQKGFLVLYNFHLISYEDSWLNKTFVELLIFILTYRFYYDRNGTRVAVDDALAFVVCSDSMDSIDVRLKSIACKPIELQASRASCFESIEADQITNIEAPCFLTIACPLLSHGSICANLQKQLCQDNKQVQVFKFSSYVQADQSLEALENLLENQFQLTRTQIEHMFVITETELMFMGAERRSRLLHVLNLLLMHGLKSFRFSYVAEADSTSHYQICLSSMSYRTLGKLFLVEHNLDESINESLSSIFDGLDKNESNWLKDKFSSALKLVELESDLKRLLSMSFAITFKAMLALAKENLTNQIKLFSCCLDNLAQFEAKIERTKELREHEDQLVAEQKIKLEKMIECIDMQLRNSQEQQKQIEQLTGAHREKTLEVERKAARIELELASVKPLVEASSQEVNKCLRPEIVNEIKSLRQPPKVIKDILDVLFVLLGQTDTSWTFIRSYLTKYSLKDELTNFDLQNRLNEFTLAKLDEEIAQKGDSFSRTQATRASIAIVPMLDWIEAVRQYGKMRMKLRPLDSSKSKLERESEQIRDSMLELRAKQTEIDKKIELDREKLEKLRADCAEAKQRSKQIAGDLERAQQVRANLAGQIERWQSKLRLFKLLNEPRKMHRICLLAAYLACLHSGTSKSKLLNGLDEMLRLLEFDKETIEDGKQTVFSNILSSLSEDFGENLMKFGAISKRDELERLVELLIVHLNLTFRSRTELIPCLLVSSADECTQDEVQRRLSARRIVCDTPRDLLVLRPHLDKSTNNNGDDDDDDDEDAEWLRSAEFGSKTGKIIVLDMRHTGELRVPVWLEVVNFCRGLSQATAEQQQLQVIRTLPKTVLLAASSLSSASIKSLGLRPVFSVNLVGGGLELASSPEEVRSSLADALVELDEPQLGAQMASLELELEQKQRTSREMEAKLVERLSRMVASDGSDGCARADTQVDQQLVGALSDMHQLSLELTERIGQIENKLTELGHRRGQFAALANEASELYFELLAARARNSPLCRTSLAAYARIVSAGNKSGRLDLETIIAHFMRPLDCNARESLLKEARAYLSRRSCAPAASLDTSLVAKRAANLGASLLELITELGAGRTNNAGAQEQSRHADFRLAIVLHDSKKSSPQIEIDELFRQLVAGGGPSAPSVCYKKVYASSGIGGKHEQREQTTSRRQLSAESSARFMAEVLAFGGAEDDAQQPQKALAHNNGFAPATVACLCVANAHLASRSFAERLVGKLARVRAGARRPAPMLLVLVGESEQDGACCSHCPFDANLIESAHLKCWHDELALGMRARFHLLRGLLSAREPAGRRLLDSLVLLHVVCQQLTRCRLAKLSWRREHYTFDLDQLLLAARALNELAKCTGGENGADSDKGDGDDDDDDELRNAFADRLESIAYGARLECTEDERLLERLLAGFVRNPSSAKNKLALFERRRQLGTSSLPIDKNNASESDVDDSRLLSELLSKELN